MDLKISHSCPSCGGPVEMHEADRLTECPFCDVKNYMVGGKMLRFVLPDAIPDHIDRESILYFPYLRFKGNIYTCSGRSVGFKVLDTTHRGIDAHLVPPSLGLRPQAMKITMARESLGGRFVKRRAKPAAVLKRAEKLVDSVFESGTEEICHRAFIGESVSCLYLPLYIENDALYDGILNRRLGTTESAGAWLSNTDNLLPYNSSWQPRFLAMICPRCGDTMEGEPDSIILHCFNCDSSWEEVKGRFQRVPCAVVASDERAVQLPFWRIRVESGGIDMKTMGDMLAVANQAVVIRDAHRRRGLEFWIPAVKIRPSVFITLAKGATLSQLKYPAGTAALSRNLQAVTLPGREAIQALKSVFAELSVNRKDVLPMLPKLSFSIKACTLVFLPFADTGHDYVQVHSGLSVASSVVRLGRKL